MNRTQEGKLRTSLTAVLEKWLEGEGNDLADLPHLGNNTAEIMAGAAIAVLLGMDDAQDDMIANDLLKED